MNKNMISVSKAAERYFRCYEAHCVKSDLDTLFHLLNALHSLNDKLLKSYKINFYEVNEFVALQALRNLFHHKEELLNEVRLINVKGLQLISDIRFLCLIPRELVEQSISEIPIKRRVKEEPIIRSVLKWYGGVVNINPCLFNFSVHVFEILKPLDLELTSPEYVMFKTSYDHEARNGLSHFIDGNISTHAGSINEMLSTLFANVD